MSLCNYKIARFVGLVATCGFLLAGLGCSGGKYLDGRYEGTAEGVHGPVVVAVTVVHGRIATVKVTSAAESGVAALAMEKIPAEIVKAQDSRVEAVTGASASSKAIMDATAAALATARKAN